MESHPGLTDKNQFAPLDSSLKNLDSALDQVDLALAI
jgi:hypothetical protein